MDYRCLVIVLSGGKLKKDADDCVDQRRTWAEVSRTPSWPPVGIAFVERNSTGMDVFLNPDCIFLGFNILYH